MPTNLSLSNPQQPGFAPDKPLSTAASAPTPAVSDVRPRLVGRLPGRYMKDIARREDTPATSAGSDSSVDEPVQTFC